MGSVAIIGPAEQRDVVIGATFRPRQGVADDRPIGIVREVETAGTIQALDRGVGVDAESPDQNRSVDDELQRTQLRCAVEDCLNEGRIIRAPAGADVTVEFGSGLAGDHHPRGPPQITDGMRRDRGN